MPVAQEFGESTLGTTCVPMAELRRARRLWLDWIVEAELCYLHLADTWPAPSKWRWAARDDVTSPLATYRCHPPRDSWRRLPHLPRGDLRSLTPAGRRSPPSTWRPVFSSSLSTWSAPAGSAEEFSEEALRAEYEQETRELMDSLERTALGSSGE